MNLGPNVNSAGFEYYPCISADGTTLYFTVRDRLGGFGGDDIWISTWDGMEWAVPVNAGPNVNWEWRDLSPSISADGMKLYFVSWGRPGGYGSYDIWVSMWEDTMWGPAVNVGPNINTPDIEWSVSISSDEKKLYFASDRVGTRGDIDIWVSEWDSANSQWGPATNLGQNINTFSRDYCPSISSDGTRLYFARWWGVQEYVDIYISEWEDTTWGPALNLGPPINTLTWDNGPSISSDGARLYFASSRDTSNPAVQDIWVSEWLPGVEERPGGRKGNSEVRFFQCQPNPFLSSTRIRFSLPTSCDVNIRIYDMTGRLVTILVQEATGPGTHGVLWDSRNDKGEAVKSGIYFCRLATGHFRQTRKIVLIR